MLLLKNPINLLRARLTRGLQVRIEAQEVRRGEELEVFVTVSGSRRPEDLHVGLVCTEYFAVEMTTSSGSSQGTSWDTAYKSWVPVQATPGVHTRRIPVPPGVPFSYEGELLCFRWEVVARGTHKRRFDARATAPISVLP